MADSVALIAFACAAGLLIVAAVTDATRFQIPNWVCAALAIAFVPAAISSAGMAFWPGLLVGLGLFVAGYALFAAKLVGGGDAKLISAVALWAGPALIFDFVLITALLGGVLAVWVAARHWWAAPGPVAAQPLPYGVAIAGGGLWVVAERAGLGPIPLI